MANWYQNRERQSYTPLLMTKKESNHSIDLFAIALQTMSDAGFVTDWPAAVAEELKQIKEKTLENNSASVPDLQGLLWSSIDDSKSRDLDQVEYAETLLNGNTKLLIGIADVDAF